MNKGKHTEESSDALTHRPPLARSRLHLPPPPPPWNQPLHQHLFKFLRILVSFPKSTSASPASPHTTLSFAQHRNLLIHLRSYEYISRTLHPYFTRIAPFETRRISHHGTPSARQRPSDPEASAPRPNPAMYVDLNLPSACLTATHADHLFTNSRLVCRVRAVSFRLTLGAFSISLRPEQHFDPASGRTRWLHVWRHLLSGTTANETSYRHLTLIMSVARYSLSYVTFNYYSRVARWSYRLTFLSAALTYGIVVYKTLRARSKAGAKAPQSPLALVADENVQYLGEHRPFPPSLAASSNPSLQACP